MHSANYASFESDTGLKKIMALYRHFRLAPRAGHQTSLRSLKRKPSVSFLMFFLPDG